MEPSNYDLARYLTAKRSVDDRALNRGVLDAFARELSSFEAPRLLELGAGLGTMVERLHGLGLLRAASYTLLDRDADSAREAVHRLRSFGERQGAVTGEGSRLHLTGERGALALAVEQADMFEYLRGGCEPGAYDAVIAHAVLDLVHVPALLPLVWRALVPGGVAWLTLNFDGETIFVPELPLDCTVMHLYHRSMDTRTRDDAPAGDSRTGRKLLSWLPASGATLLAAGSSDWVVWPSHGGYPQDEGYFLHHIVHTIDAELRGHPELDRTAFAAWVRARHAQIESGTLVYIAHQLDVLARAPD